MTYYCWLREEAVRLANALVSGKLVTCVQIESIEGLYPWKGQLKHEHEWRLLCKSTFMRADELLKFVEKHHPYELPAIYLTEVLQASEGYGDWVHEMTAIE
ncbi:MAG: divalent-cation tolerance protein CutA [Limnohabitans sp.]|nr:divalent-cation tolerance protein CutA [Limnohabitans sp.]